MSRGDNQIISRKINIFLVYNCKGLILFNGSDACDVLQQPQNVGVAKFNFGPIHTKRERHGRSDIAYSLSLDWVWNLIWLEFASNATCCLSFGVNSIIGHKSISETHKTPVR